MSTRDTSPPNRPGATSPAHTLVLKLLLLLVRDRLPTWLLLLVRDRLPTWLLILLLLFVRERVVCWCACLPGGASSRPTRAGAASVPKEASKLRRLLPPSLPPSVLTALRRLALLLLLVMPWPQALAATASGGVVSRALGTGSS
jgi:hypothetical protein